VWGLLAHRALHALAIEEIVILPRQKKILIDFCKHRRRKTNQFIERQI